MAGCREGRKRQKATTTQSRVKHHARRPPEVNIATHAAKRIEMTRFERAHLGIHHHAEVQTCTGRAVRENQGGHALGPSKQFATADRNHQAPTYQ